MISVVFPVYNEEYNVAELHRRLKEVLVTLGEPYEIIAVDDGSSDRTREVLETLRPVTIVALTRNYGQNAALDAGIHHARGDIIITIDSDLQNPPEEISKLWHLLQKGYDVVIGWRRNRHDSAARRIFSRLANTLVARATGVRVHDFSCALKCYRREFIEGVRLLGETFIFLPVFAHAKGARIGEVEIRHEERKRGASKHGIMEMSNVFFDLISVKFLLDYFLRPMRFFGRISFVVFLLALVSFGWAGFLKIAEIQNLSDTPLPLIGVMGMVLSSLLFILGFLAEILLRIYHMSQSSTPYSIKEVIEYS